MRLLQSIFAGGKAKKPDSQSNLLLQKLSKYPANTPPHLGLRRALTPAQLDSNLAYLVDNCDMRLTHICAFLASFNIDASPLVDPAQNPYDAVCAIDHWITEQADAFKILPRSAAGVCPIEEFQNSNRSNDEIVFSLVADLALLEGEAIRRRDDRYYWAINREAKLRSNETAKRPCLMRPIQPDWTMPIALDLEMATLAIIHERRSNMGVLHKFGEQMIAIVNGAYSA